MANEVRVRVIAEDRASKPIGDIKREAGGLGGTFQSAQRNWLALSAAIAATEGTRRIVMGMVNAASELEESLNKNRVIFGAASAEVEKFGDVSAKSFGLSRNEALAATGAFGNMFNTAGLVREESARMSVQMTKLAADMASFNNEDPSDMLLRLRSGLAGEAEPLRRFGVLLSEAAVKAKAMEIGIGDASGKLTEAEKVQARYALILDQTSVQQGDFARTSDSLANQQRKLNAQLEDLQANLGELLLPAMTEFVSLLAAATEETNRLVAALKELPSGGGGTGGFFGAIGDALAATGDFGGDLFRNAGGAVGLLQDLLEEGFSGAWDRRGQSGRTSGTGAAGALDGVAAALAEVAISADDLTTGAGGGGGLAALRLAAERAAARAAELERAEGGLSSIRQREVTAALRAVQAEEERRANVLRSTVERNTAELVEAYIRGGDAAVAETRAKQAELSASWAEISKELAEKLGVEFPDYYRAMHDSIKDGILETTDVIKEAMRDAADAVRQNLRNLQTTAFEEFGTGGVAFQVGTGDGGTFGGAFATAEEAWRALVAGIRVRGLEGTPEAEAIIEQGRQQIGNPIGNLVISVKIGDREFNDAVATAVESNAARGR